MLSNVDNTFHETSALLLFYEHPQNPNEIHPSVLRACYLESMWNRKSRKKFINALDSKLSKYIKIFKKFHNLFVNARL